MFERGLRWAGFSVAAFPNADAFMEVLEERMPDVLVLDWMLPGTTAADLLRRLRRDARTRDLRVVILSGLPFGGGTETDVALGYGALAWLEKWKTTPAVLAQRIREALPA